jgi:hypothetical protein
LQHPHPAGCFPLRWLVSGAWELFSLVAKALRRAPESELKCGTESKALGAAPAQFGQHDAALKFAIVAKSVNGPQVSQRYS